MMWAPLGIPSVARSSSSQAVLSNLDHERCLELSSGILAGRMCHSGRGKGIRAPWQLVEDGARNSGQNNARESQQMQNMGKVYLARM